MKIIILLALWICQPAFNQTIKVEKQWSDRDRMFLCKVYNINRCDSYIEVDFGTGPFTIPRKLKKGEFETVAIVKNGIIKVRSVNTCNTGTKGWLTIHGKK